MVPIKTRDDGHGLFGAIIMGTGGRQRDSHLLKAVAVDYQRQRPGLFIKSLEAHQPPPKEY